MRRILVLLCLVGVAGCGRGFEQKVVGTWRVDPASIKTTHLLAGSEKKTDWTDAAETIGKVEVTFVKNGVVSVSGFNTSSTGKWQLRGNQIDVTSSENWPKMVLDAGGTRIHLTDERSDGELQMDLVKK